MPPARTRTRRPRVGIDVTREKLKITALSAAHVRAGRRVFAQYQMYIGPDTIAGLGVSLNIVFAVIAGGMWVLLGPTVGAVFTQVLAEGLRVAIQGSATLRSLFGSSALALDQLIYGLLLILFIIYMPKGILGTLLEWREKEETCAPPRSPRAARDPELRSTRRPACSAGTLFPAFARGMLCPTPTMHRESRHLRRLAPLRPSGVMRSAVMRLRLLRSTWKR